MKLKPEQLEAFALQVQTDWTEAASIHQRRLDRGYRLLQAFRNNPDRTGDERTGYRSPLITETIQTKVARMLTSLLGPQRKITGQPIGQSDTRAASKAAAFMDWAFFENKSPIVEMAKGLIIRGIFGRAFWYTPWTQKHDLEGNLIWEGHDLILVPPADFLHSNEPGVRSVQDFEWCAMKYWESRRTLHEQIANGEYPYLKGVDLETLFDTTPRWDEETEINRLDDDIEGIDRDTATNSDRAGELMPRGLVPMVMWFGWIKIGKKYEHVRIRKPIRPHHVIASIDLLRDLYKGCSNPRPFRESGELSHGPYYPKSTAAYCEPAEETLTEAFRDMHKGASKAASPPIMADQETADQITAQEQGAGRVIVVNNPQNAVPLMVPYNPEFFQITSTAVRADRDRLVGHTDYMSGRDISSPTAPKTASGLLALIQEGNIRLSLDMNMFALDLCQWFKDLAELWASKADPNVQFRVTESYPDLLTQGGTAKMFETDEERGGRYDYSLKFAPSPMEANATLESTINAYQLGLTNPLIMNNPRVMHKLTVAMLRALNQTEVAFEMVEPPDNMPVPPEREHNTMLQGEMPKVHDGDDHDLHLTAHYAFIEWQRNSARPDKGAIRLALQHIVEHNRKKKEAAMFQAALSGVAESLRSGEGGLMAPPQPLPIEQVIAQQGMQQIAQKGAPSGSL